MVVDNDLRIIDNPLAKHLLTILRSKDTGNIVFRDTLYKLGFILGYEISRELEWRETRVETPLAEAEGILPNKPLWIVAVLGAGIPLATGIHNALPWAGLGLLAARRIEENGIRVEIYYERLPRDLNGSPIIIADPMLATGNTMIKVIDIVRERRAGRLFLATVIASKYGLTRVFNAFRGVKVYTIALDPELNDRMFIVPGLGDAGDRAFNPE